jgi:hypothetical protein
MEGRHAGDSGDGTVSARAALLDMTEQEPNISSAIRARLQGIREWMAEEAPYVATDQRHLDEHTPERAYWHYGYQAALSDVLALIEGLSSQEQHNHPPDTSS